MSIGLPALLLLCATAAACQSTSNAGDAPDDRFVDPLIVLDRSARPGIFLSDESGSSHYFHMTWFIDTRGQQFELVARDRASDVMDWVTIDHKVTWDEVAELAAASNRLPGAVSRGDMRLAAKLLPAASDGTIEKIGNRPCSDFDGGSSISAYRFDREKDAFVAIPLQTESCGAILSHNSSIAAQKLAAWSYKVRGMTPPYR